VDSIAGVIYCAGKHRVCVEEGRFLIHGVANTFPGTDPSIGEKDLQDHLTGLRKDRDSVAAILAARTETKLAKVKEDMLNTAILTAEDAKAYGFVHEVSDEIFDPSQEIIHIVSSS
jgi:ATP-dependent protease ClpP protease subunit